MSSSVPRKAVVKSPALPLTGCVTFGKSFNLSVPPQGLHLQNTKVTHTWKGCLDEDIIG